jgi:Sporulation and spore germination
MIPRHLQIALALMVCVLLALGIWAWNLKRNSDAIDAHQADTRPAAPPVAGVTSPVTLFVAYDEEGLLRARQEIIPLPPEPGERARQALRALLAVYVEKPSPHPLGDGADVKDVYLVNDNTVVIDMNSAFADKHRSGILVEQLTVVSMLQTISAALPKVTRACILVEGKPRPTLAGHADLSGFYDIAMINQLAKELQ